MAKKDEEQNKVALGRLEFEGLGEESAPQLTVTRVDQSGMRHPMELSKDGALRLDGAHVGSRHMVELSGPGGEEPRTYHYDELYARLLEDKLYTLPKIVWQRWWPRLRCVAGAVEVCRPPYLFDAVERHDATVLHAAGLGVVPALNKAIAEPAFIERWPWLCRPVCDGRVSVYIQTCCCPWFDPGQILIDICKIINCDLEQVPWPKIPDLGDPGPLSHVAPSPDHSAAVADTLKRSMAGEAGLPSPNDVIGLFQHHAELSRLEPRAQVAYVNAHPELRWLLCRCSMVKVAEVSLQEDGAFEACFVLPWAGRGCSQRVVYVVTQATSGGTHVIYDGRTVPRTFALDEEAHLQASWTARTCGRDDTLGEGVFLNRIGSSTSAVALVRSADQDGELSFTPLAPDDGLVNGGANVWGGTLALRYTFNPSLQGLGARYYRIRVQRVDDLGNAIGSPETHTTPIAWGHFQGNQIVSTTIGPNPPGAPAGANLYTIPYYADGWDFDANSYHAFIDTSGFVANGRYLFVIDLFDHSGARLVPSDSGPAAAGEVSKAFVYQRMVPSSDPNVVNLAVVPQKALANLFKVDNTPAVAAFKGLHQSGSKTLDLYAGCQYVTGLSSDGVQLWYQAHQDRGWLAAVSANLTHGIGGSTTSLLAGSTTDTGVPPAMALTPVKTLGDLLGDDPKCSFAATMEVTTRHTNGSGPLVNLWAFAVAAFALEQTGS
jgi:hypothetical protein